MKSIYLKPVVMGILSLLAYLGIMLLVFSKI